MEDHFLQLEPHRQAQKGSLEPTVQLQVLRPGPAIRADPLSPCLFDVKGNHPIPEFCPQVPVAFQAHRMVQVTRGRQVRPLVLSSQTKR